MTRILTPIAIITTAIILIALFLFSITWLVRDAINFHKEQPVLVLNPLTSKYYWSTSTALRESNKLRGYDLPSPKTKYRPKIILDIHTYNQQGD